MHSTSGEVERGRIIKYFNHTVDAMTSLEITSSHDVRIMEKNPLVLATAYTKSRNYFLT